MPIHETAANLSNTKKKQSEKFEGCSNFSEWSALSKILLLLFSSLSVKGNELGNKHY